MDVFQSKNIKPMLIGKIQDAFDHPDFIFELKLDGERCLAYLDKSEGTVLRNKRNIEMLPKVPELSSIHNQIKNRCILDGELVIIRNGKPDFSEIQRRSLMSDKFRHHLYSKKLPASFIAFDILYLGNDIVTDLPLSDRKKLLDDILIENERIAISRYIKGNGKDYYNLTEQHQLEGIVAKRKDSRYYFGIRTKDWIKIKNLQDDDFIICGYILKENNVASLILGQYSMGALFYKGRVTMGISAADFSIIKSVNRLSKPLFQGHSPEKHNTETLWLEPVLVCTVRFMMKTKEGAMRQPVYKGLRNDKLPSECVEKQ